jgi:hypothetical protein
MHGFSWVLVAARPGYRQPWPLGLPWPLCLLQHGKGQGAPAPTPLVVPPRLPKNPPWRPPQGEPGGSLRESRAPAQRIRSLARKPCKEPYRPGIQVVRLTDPDHPDDIDRSTLVSRPNGGLCRLRLSTSSKHDIVHLTASPGHPAGVGRTRIEDLGTQPVLGRAPWVHAWGAPALTLDWGLEWPRMPPNIHDQNGELLHINGASHRFVHARRHQACSWPSATVNPEPTPNPLPRPWGREAPPTNQLTRRSAPASRPRPGASRRLVSNFSSNLDSPTGCPTREPQLSGQPSGQPLV